MEIKYRGTEKSMTLGCQRYPHSLGDTWTPWGPTYLRWHMDAIVTYATYQRLFHCVFLQSDLHRVCNPQWLVYCVFTIIDLFFIIFLESIEKWTCSFFYAFYIFSYLSMFSILLYFYILFWCPGGPEPPGHQNHRF